jgi:hypothetical protein
MPKGHLHSFRLQEPGSPEKILLKKAKARAKNRLFLSIRSFHDRGTYPSPRFFFFVTLIKFKYLRRIGPSIHEIWVGGAAVIRRVSRESWNAGTSQWPGIPVYPYE